MTGRGRAVVPLLAAAALAVGLVPRAAPPAGAAAGSVALVGSLQSELGCPGDWQPDCAATELTPSGDGTWAAEFDVPAGSWEYKVAYDDAWTESYGREGGADNAPLTIAGTTRLRFTFDEASHLIGVAPVDLTGAYTAADDALVTAPVREAGAGEQFYFVMTDRFANGDTTNDDAGLGADRLVSGFDPTDKGFYHGGDLAGLRAQLDYIQGLGTTAIWLTPSFLNKPVQGEGADASAGYHGYWITDFTQIDPHLGTNAELAALIDDAHARGIDVFFDIITNHTADVISYQGGSDDYVDQATRPYTDAGGTAFDPADYAGTSDFPTLDPATSFPYVPQVDPAEANVKVPSWLNDVTRYHNRGDSTYTGESTTYGDFSGLDDLMTEDPVVVDGFIDVYNTWVDLGIDGFRIDTVKHVNPEFWEAFTSGVMDHARAIGKDDFFLFGEVYDADATKTAPYVRDTEMQSVLDFAFQSAASTYARGFSPDTLTALFASDDWYTTPDSTSTALPTFLGNHDMGRIGYQLRDDPDGLARSELAHTLMLTSRGQPVVYYGDEQGFVGDGSLGGTDKDARQDMFATQVAEYANQQLLTGETAGSVARYDTSAPLYTHIAELAALRSATPALVDGAQLERPVTGSDAVYAFSRVDPDERVEHLVALNNATSDATVTVTTVTPGATFTPLYGGGAPVTAAADGTVTLTVPALDALVLAASATVAPVAGGPTLSVASPAPGAALTGDPAVSATVADAWAQTSFAYRVVGDTAWTPLGTAEDSTPRVFADLTGLAEGTLVEYRAVTTDAAGARAAASSYGSVGFAVDGAVPPPPPDDDLGNLVVTAPGSHQSEAGCPGDWDPACPATELTHRGNGLYAGTFTIPAGTWEYKIAIGRSWDTNYGAGGVPGGANVSFTLAQTTDVTFVFDEVSHAFTTTAQGPLMTLPGSYQSEAGCAGDWDPGCLATVLLDGDGDGLATFTTSAIPAGTYEVKVAVGQTWDVNYGVGGPDLRPPPRRRVARRRRRRRDGRGAGAADLRPGGPDGGPARDVPAARGLRRAAPARGHVAGRRRRLAQGQGARLAGGRRHPDGGDRRPGAGRPRRPVRRRRRRPDVRRHLAPRRAVAGRLGADGAGRGAAAVARRGHLRRSAARGHGAPGRRLVDRPRRARLGWSGVPVRGHGLRTVDGRRRGQRGHRPRVGRPHPELDALRPGGPGRPRLPAAPVAPGAPAAGRARGPDDLRAPRPRLLDQRRDGARRPAWDLRRLRGAQRRHPAAA